MCACVCVCVRACVCACGSRKLIPKLPKEKAAAAAEDNAASAATDAANTSAADVGNGNGNNDAEDTGKKQDRADLVTYIKRFHAHTFDQWTPFNNARIGFDKFNELEVWVDYEDFCKAHGNFLHRGLNNSAVFAVNNAIFKAFEKHKTGGQGSKLDPWLKLGIRQCLRVAFPNNVYPWLLRTVHDVEEKVPALFVRLLPSTNFKLAVPADSATQDAIATALCREGGAPGEESLRKKTTI